MNLRAHYRRICARAGLGTFVGEVPVKPKGRPGRQKRPTFKPLLTPYALRHTHATLLLEDGVPIEEISGRLGHAKTSFTYDTYIGKQRQQKRAVAASSKRLLALNGST